MSERPERGKFSHGPLIEQLFARLPAVAAKAATLMFVVMVGMAPCTPRIRS
jgi:hypothetical protein